jgi:hypothetical protein
MPTQTIGVPQTEGLHARPAAQFVKLANRFQSTVTEGRVVVRAVFMSVSSIVQDVASQKPGRSASDWRCRMDGTDFAERSSAPPPMGCRYVETIATVLRRRLLATKITYGVFC